MKKLPKGWKPESPEHAVKCLQSWVKQWDKLVKGTVGPPWTHNKFDPGDKDIWIYGRTACDQGNPGYTGFMRMDYDDVDHDEVERTVKLVEALGPLVHGMMAGVEALLKEWHRMERIRAKQHEQKLTDHGESWQMAIGFILVTQVREYAPWMIKAGMDVPER